MPGAIAVRAVLSLAAAYMCGSLPTAYLMGLLKGIDIRREGSGNVGATNALRVLGTRWGLACLLVDILKGFLPTYLLGAALGARAAWAAGDGWMWAVGAAAIAGHMFSPFLNFRGGKGVATTLGVVLAIAPIPVAIVFALGVAIIMRTGYVSLASIAGSALLPILIVAFGTPHAPGPLRAWMSFFVTLILGALIIWKHRANIERLKAGTEKKILRRANN